MENDWHFRTRFEFFFVMPPKMLWRSLGGIPTVPNYIFDFSPWLLQVFQKKNTIFRQPKEPYPKGITCTCHLKRRRFTQKIIRSNHCAKYARIKVCRGKYGLKNLYFTIFYVVNIWGIAKWRQKLLGLAFFLFNWKCKWKIWTKRLSIPPDYQTLIFVWHSRALL